MAQPSSPLGGGGPLALCILLGVVIGLIAGQPTLGFLGGLAIGAAIAVWVWRAGPRS